jgi:signal transduction histidine kinase
MAVLVTAVVLLGSATLVLVVYRNQLISSLDQTLEKQVADRVQLLDAGNPPESLTTALQEESLVWIGTLDGVAVAQGGQLRFVDPPPLPRWYGATVEVKLRVEELKPDEREVELTTLRLSSGLAEGPLAVLAGAESETIDKAIGDLARIFAVALIPLSFAAAALAWALTGRTLHPVEAIRSQAEAIGGATLDERVPVPDGKDEIHALAETMNLMLDRIESHDRSLRQFTADASHELKSPVANLRALVDTSHLTGPEWETLKGTLVGETDRLASLVENLLYLTLDDAGHVSNTQHTVELDEIVFAEASVIATTHDTTVDLSGVQPATIKGSATEIAQMLRNLLDNAARHAGSRLEVGIDSTSPLTLRVGDDGPGINESDRERVFERFTRLDDARARDAGGSGLGLAIVRRIATRHDATVEIGESDLGGAEVIVRFRGETRDSVE